MRIIAGKLRGRTIPVPKNFKGRPTTDYARESLFNVLQHQVDYNDLRVIDLFSGTGAFALECFSRGAEDILALDIEAIHVKAIRDNFKTFGALKAQVMKTDTLRYLKDPERSFDLIFADAPYGMKGLEELPSLIMNSTLPAPGALAVVEHPENYDFSKEKGFQQHRKYGNVHFSFFRNLQA